MNGCAMCGQFMWKYRTQCIVVWQLLISQYEEIREVYMYLQPMLVWTKAIWTTTLFPLRITEYELDLVYLRLSCTQVGQNDEMWYTMCLFGSTLRGQNVCFSAQNSKHAFGKSFQKCDIQKCVFQFKGFLYFGAGSFELQLQGWIPHL